jgi:hypothetical protein
MTENENAAVDRVTRVLPVPTEPFPPGYDSAEEVRQLHASSWVNVGVTDPEEVRRWVDAGVHNARVARDAIRQGYKPTDPWVERGPSSFTLSDGQPVTPPGALTAWRNRRRAHAEWKASQRRRAEIHAEAQHQATQMADALRGESFDVGNALVSLDVLAGTGAPITDQDVIRAFDELLVDVAAIRSQVERDGFLSSDHADQVEHYLVMVDVVDQNAGICTVEEQATIRAQLDDVRSFLRTATR